VTEWSLLQSPTQEDTVHVGQAQLVVGNVFVLIHVTGRTRGDWNHAVGNHAGFHQLVDSDGPVAVAVTDARRGRTRQRRRDCLARRVI